ncbi:hypothetical protein EW026_g5809 [Hermanssonia centrifuga]|nr:hypothetical protein EW026_g5809 [Hermanssonia centrifuga]
MQAHWAKRALIVQANKMNGRGLPLSSSTPDLKKQTSSTSTVIKEAATLRSALPFILSHDIVRGILYAGQAALQYAFMLAVMTFQVGFIFAIVVGLGVGETLFGRYAIHATHIA